MAVLGGKFPVTKKKNKPSRNDIINEKNPLMSTKPTPEEITRKKEYVRFLNNQIYKLTSQRKFLHKQLVKLTAQLKDYENRKEKNRKMIKRELISPLKNPPTLLYYIP